MARFEPMRRFDGAAVRIAPDNSFVPRGREDRKCVLCGQRVPTGTLMRRRGDGYVHAMAGACPAQLEALEAIRDGEGAPALDLRSWRRWLMEDARSRA